MDISSYGLEDLLLSALRSEVDSKEAYSKLADGVKNFFLKDRLKFLAGEEEKHKIFLEGVFKEQFPKKEIILPKQTPVPLPEIKISDENIPISEVLESAMNAEKAAYEFYIGLAERFLDDAEMNKKLLYIASMEDSHYKILEIERKNALEFEHFDQVWPMMHAGP